MSTTCRVHKKYLEKEVFKNLNRIQDYDFNKESSTTRRLQTTWNIQDGPQSPALRVQSGLRLVMRRGRPRARQGDESHQGSFPGCRNRSRGWQMQHCDYHEHRNEHQDRHGSAKGPVPKVQVAGCAQGHRAFAGVQRGDGGLSCSRRGLA